MLQTVWARMITHWYPSLQLTVYVDDRTVRGPERQSFLDALTDTARFDTAAGHELNWTKTDLTAAIPGDRQWLKARVTEGRSCPVFGRTKTLGIQLSAQRRKIAVIGAKRGSKGIADCQANHQICSPTLMETPSSSGKSIQASSLWYFCFWCAQESDALTGWPIAVAPLEHVIRLSLPRDYLHSAS